MASTKTTNWHHATKAYIVVKQDIVKQMQVECNIYNVSYVSYHVSSFTDFYLTFTLYGF